MYCIAIAAPGSLSMEPRARRSSQRRRTAAVAVEREKHSTLSSAARSPAEPGPGKTVTPQGKQATNMPNTAKPAGPAIAAQCSQGPRDRQRPWLKQIALGKEETCLGGRINPIALLAPACVGRTRAQGAIRAPWEPMAVIQPAGCRGRAGSRPPGQEQRAPDGVQRKYLSSSGLRLPPPTRLSQPVPISQDLVSVSVLPLRGPLLHSGNGCGVIYLCPFPS
ncbi:unnamed protein product [Lepidochelys olivacea]